MLYHFHLSYISNLIEKTKRSATYVHKKYTTITTKLETKQKDQEIQINQWNKNVLKATKFQSYKVFNSTSFKSKTDFSQSSK